MQLRNSSRPEARFPLQGLVTMGKLKGPGGRLSPGASYLTLGRSTVTGSAAASGCR